MRTVTAWLAAVLLLACGSELPEPKDEMTVDLQPVEMPEHPAPVRGRLVGRVVGVVEFDPSWPARAGRCAEPPMLQLLAEGPDGGVLVLLMLPEEGSAQGEYEVMQPQASQHDEWQAAVALQHLATGRVNELQAHSGKVEVERADATLRGRFTVTMRHLRSAETAAFAAAFDAVPIEELPQDECRLGR